jgi:hypothetical protein
MTSIALGGVLQGLMQGYDYQNELNRRAQLDEEDRQQREVERRRQARADHRLETTFANEQADRAHDLERQPTLEAREDETYGLQSAIRKLQLEGAKFDATRAPIEATQKDRAFEADMRSKRQAARLDAMRAELARLGIDEKRVNQSRQQAREQLFAGFAQGRMTGDWDALRDAYNGSIANTHGGSPVTAITEEPDGSFTITSGSGTARFRDQSQLMQMAAAITDPTTYVEGLLEAAKSQADQPAAIKETNAIFKRLAPQQGETDDDRWMRAFALRSTRASEDPANTAASFYQTVMKTGYTEPKEAMAQTKDFMRKFFPDSHGFWNPKPASNAQPVFADPGTGIAPPPRFALPSFMQSGPQGQGGIPGARQAPDGNWYVPDPNRPGGYLLIQQ